MKLGEINQVEKALRELEDPRIYGMFATKKFIENFERRDIVERSEELRFELILFLEVLHKNSKIYFKDHLGNQLAIVNVVNPRTFGAYGALIPYVFCCYTKNLSTWKEEVLKKNIRLRVLDPIKFFALFKPQVRLVEDRRIKSVETIN